MSRFATLSNESLDEADEQQTSTISQSCDKMDSDKSSDSSTTSFPIHPSTTSVTDIDGFETVERQKPKRKEREDATSNSSSSVSSSGQSLSTSSVSSDVMVLTPHLLELQKLNALPLRASECASGGSSLRYFYILRGLPGCGKSYLGQSIARYFQQTLQSSAVICSADDFFLQSISSNQSQNFNGSNVSSPLPISPATSPHNSARKPESTAAANSSTNSSTTAALPASPTADGSMSAEQKYVFDPRLISQAHSQCLNKCLQAIRSATPAILIDNTHIQRWEYQNYALLAEMFGYRLVIVQIFPSAESGLGKEMIARMKARGLHDVPISSYEGMMKRFEDDERAIHLNPVFAPNDPKTAPQSSHTPIPQQAFTQQPHWRSKTATSASAQPVAQHNYIQHQQQQHYQQQHASSRPRYGQTPGYGPAQSGGNMRNDWRVSAGAYGMGGGHSLSAAPTSSWNSSVNSSQSQLQPQTRYR